MSHKLNLAVVIASSFCIFGFENGALAADPPPAAAKPAAPAAAPPVKPYTPKPPAVLTTGQALMRLRLTSVNGTPVQSDYIRAVPVVLGVKGNKVGFGGKYGPQVTGTINGGTLSVSGPTPGGATLTLTGTGGGAQGKWTISQGGVTLGGEYVLDPVQSGVLGETRAGVGTTSGFTNMTPATAGWNPTGTKAPGVAGNNAGNGYSTGMQAPAAGSRDYATNAQKVAGMTAPGMGNSMPGGLGPNFGGTPLSGWFADGDDVSPTSPVGPPKTGGDTTGPKDPNNGKLGAFGAPKGDNADNSSWWDKAKKWWNGFSLTGSSTPSGGKTGTKEGNPMDDGSHDAGTSGSGLNFGRIPGAGGEKGGGNTSVGGVNAANGSTLNKPQPLGDNPFDVPSADVLNTNHLINGASDPGITRGIGH